MEAYILQNSQKEPSNQGRAHSNVMKKFAGLKMSDPQRRH